jgi:hypothetical protein
LRDVGGGCNGFVGRVEIVILGLEMRVDDVHDGPS